MGGREGLALSCPHPTRARCQPDSNATRRRPRARNDTRRALLDRHVTAGEARLHPQELDYRYMTTRPYSVASLALPGRDSFHIKRISTRAKLPAAAVVLRPPAVLRECITVPRGFRLAMGYVGPKGPSMRARAPRRPHAATPLCHFITSCP